MDDSRFDDIIKNKVEEFDAVEFDPSALAAMHYKMDSSVRPSFYGRYRNEILVAAATSIIAMLILFGLNGAGNNTALQEQILALKDQNDKIDKLEVLLQKSANQPAPAPDTIRVVEYRNTNDLYYNKLVGEIAQLRRQLNQVQSQPRTEDYNFRKDLVYIGREDQVSDDIIRKLGAGNVVKNGGYLFLVVDDAMVADQNPYLVKRRGLTHEYRLPDYVFVWDSTATDQYVTNVEPHPVQISVKKLKELERHYKKGIGIDIGPSVSLQRGFGGTGSTSDVLGGGLVADFILSPALSVESGFTFNMTHFDVADESFGKLSLPLSDPIYGDIQGAEISSWFLELPVTLKYRQRISQRNHIVYGAGLSAYLYTKQNIELKYFYDAGNGLTIPVESTFRIKNPELYFGTLNLSLGLRTKLKNDKRLETSFVHKTNLGSLGYEQSESNFIGLKASYFFNIR